MKFRFPHFFPCSIGLFALAFCLFSVAGALGEEVEVKGVKVPGGITCDEHPLVLNGTAVRKKFGLSVYVVALYLERLNQDCEDIMTRDKANKRVHITMLRTVTPDAFNSAIAKNIDINFSAEEKERYSAELQAFLDCFGSGSELKEGTFINIDYLPETGMRIAMDDVVLDTIPGDDFYHAILRLWIGEPLQESIKSGLLGQVSN